MPCGLCERPRGADDAAGWSPLRDHRATDLLKGGRYTAVVPMKLQQLRYLAAVVQSDLNITAAAVKLRATQSAISKQLKLLEEELGFDVFARSGRTLTRLTLPGPHAGAGSTAPQSRASLYNSISVLIPSFCRISE